VAVSGVLLLGGFLVVHIVKDLSAPVSAWYFHSTPVWLGVMAVATGVYVREIRLLRHKNVDVAGIFSKLPPE
jgi:hypothetical protein